MHVKSAADEHTSIKLGSTEWAAFVIFVAAQVIGFGIALSQLYASNEVLKDRMQDMRLIPERLQQIEVRLTRLETQDKGQ